MNDVVEATRIYWNFLIPSFPNGLTPAEVAGVEARSWMQPLLITCKETVDKVATGINPMDRYSEIVRGILTELERGQSTPRTAAVKRIIEGLRKYGSAEQPRRRRVNESRTTPKHESSTEASNLPTTIIPFVSIFAVRSVDRIRKKLREYSRTPDIEGTGYYLEEDSHDGSFAVYEPTGAAQVRLGTISFLADGRMFVGSLTSTRENVLRKFLSEILNGDLVLLEELRRVKPLDIRPGRDES